MYRSQTLNLVTVIACLLISCSHTHALVATLPQDEAEDPAVHSHEPTLEDLHKRVSDLEQKVVGLQTTLESVNQQLASVLQMLTDSAASEETPAKEVANSGTKPDASDIPEQPVSVLDEIDIRFYIEAVSYPNGILKNRFVLTNNSGVSIRSLSYRIVVYDPDRELPWVDIVERESFSGGLEPGEQAIESLPLGVNSALTNERALMMVVPIQVVTSFGPVFERRDRNAAGGSRAGRVRAQAMQSRWWRDAVLRTIEAELQVIEVRSEIRQAVANAFHGENLRTRDVRIRGTRSLDPTVWIDFEYRVPMGLPVVAESIKRLEVVRDSDGEVVHSTRFEVTNKQRRVIVKGRGDVGVWQGSSIRFANDEVAREFRRAIAGIRDSDIPSHSIGGYSVRLSDIPNQPTEIRSWHHEISDSEAARQAFLEQMRTELETN